ncbi:MAG: hypothetical protein BJBARM5_0275 [Candidatus Parvarchaeum acidophilus ARMAN-5]|uniref:Uncharacterized protein n=1 Tax=Candidatus Parvarchaeum acidophilus ARMAN-5 TaxID=662762 RepID=D6GUX6_PARA5|nr:MAG: hypothetical protein BJBARM5_0275 [Candidatus Parvarchaeum acidophilus ARMAN-5]
MESNKPKATKEKTEITKILKSFWVALISGILAIISGILVIIGNISILTFNSQSVLNALNSTSALNSSTEAYIGLAFNGISSVKNGVIVLAPLLIIAGVFMIIAAFYMKSKIPQNRRFGLFLTFLFSIFALLGLLIYVPFNSLAVLILIYLPLTSIGLAAYIIMVIYIILGLLAGAIELLGDKRYLS